MVSQGRISTPRRNQFRLDELIDWPNDKYESVQRKIWLEGIDKWFKNFMRPLI